MKKSSVLLLTLVIALFISCGDSDQNNTTPSGKISIVATTGIVADMVRIVGGEKVSVVGLMGPGVDPHLYKVSQGDIRKLSQADMIFFNGLHLEGKMVEILGKLARNKKVVAVSEKIPDSQLRRPAEFKGAPDPHIWFDVHLWKTTIRTVKRSLIEYHPSAAAEFEANAGKYDRALDSLHNWVIEELDKIPVSQRVLVTAHDAFGYFGEAYKIKVMGLQGISTLSEFGVLDISRLVSFITDNKLKAIFVESSVPEKSIQAVRQGCLGKGWQVEIGGTLYSDALGAAGSEADTYVGMVRTNVKTIVKALKD